MNLKRAFKRGIKMCIDCDMNPLTIIIRSVKEDLHHLLDRAIPDDKEKP